MDFPTDMIVVCFTLVTPFYFDYSQPSLRTHLSFSIAMTQLGGHGVFYDLRDSPLGAKESYEDTARVISR